MTHIIYLYYTLEFIKSKQPIYKIGKSTQSDFKRFKGYKKGGRLLYMSECYDCHELEKQLIDLFKTKYELKQGKEYFKGNFRRMVNDIQFACYNEQGDVALDDVINNENQIMQQNIEVTLKNIEVMQQVMQQNIELETTQRRIGNDSIIPDIVVEEWMQQYFIEEGIPDVVEDNIPDIVVEEWMHRYFIEENIPDIVVEEWMQQYFIEENIPDVEGEEWIHQYFTEERTQDVVEVNIPDAVVEEWIHQYFTEELEENIPDAVEEENIPDTVVEDVEEDDNIIQAVVEEDLENEDIVICQEVRSEFTVNNVKGRFICKICHFDTDTNGQLKQHSHTQKHMKNLENKDDVISPYKCGKCERGYQTKSGLQKHKLVCKAPEVASPEVVLPIVPERVSLDIHTRIDNLKRDIGKLTSLVENNLTRQT